MIQQENKSIVSSPGTKLYKTPGFLLLVGVILGFLVPPLGLLIAIYLLYKAIKYGIKKYYLLGLIILAVSALGFYAINRFYGAVDRSPEISIREAPYAYVYDELNEYGLSIKDSNSQISFNKPIEIKKVSDTINATSASVSLAHTNKEGHGIAYMTATLFNSTLAEDKTYLATLNEQLSRAEGVDYENVVAPVRKFVKDATAQGYDIILSKPKTFTNGSLNKNAWQFEVIAADDEGKLAPLKGSVIMAINRQTTYYLGTFALDYNWQPNEAIWKLISNSIKINQ